MSHVTHDFLQRTPEWHAHRLNTFNASEAAAMLNMSKRLTREALLRAKVLGTEEEISVVTQALFDRGHAYEDIARPWAETILEEDLFPVVASIEIDGMHIGASYDGLTLDESTAFEHKSANIELVAALKSGRIPDEYHPQLEQQLLVVGAERALFMASDGNPETALYVFYESRPELRKLLIAGWKQFQRDMANYQHVEVAPKAIGTAVMVLPTLEVSVIGSVQSSNLVEYQKAALAMIRGINTVLETDQDFADAEAMVKKLGEAEGDLERAKASALKQTTTIEELFRTIDGIAKEVRDKRLTLTNLVKVKKESVRAKIVEEFSGQYKKHVAGLVKRVGKNYVAASCPVPDLLGAMKSKKTVKALRDSAAAETNRCIMAANDTADRVQLNVAALVALGERYTVLWSDESSLTVKNSDEMRTIADARIVNFESAEKKRAADIEAKRIADEAAKAAEAARVAERVAQESLSKAAAVAVDTNRLPEATRATTIIDAQFPEVAAPHAQPPNRKAPTPFEICSQVARTYNVGLAIALDWMRQIDWQKDL